MYRNFLNYLCLRKRGLFLLLGECTNKDGDEKGKMKYCVETAKMVIE
jgi:hypothetical protein